MSIVADAEPPTVIADAVSVIIESARALVPDHFVIFPAVPVPVTVPPPGAVPLDAAVNLP